MINQCDNDDYDIEQGRVAFQKELTDVMVRAGAREVELSGPRAAEGERWQVLQTTPGESRSVFDNQKRLIANVVSGNLAQQIITEHNTHTTLVEQRDRLLIALKRMLDNFTPYSTEDTERWREEWEACEEARITIITIEQSVKNAGEGDPK